MRHVLLCVVMMAACGWAALAARPQISVDIARADFRKANQEYQQQNYEEARKLYLQLIESGIVAPELFYNMGNACERLHRNGEAILYYERARQYAPRDGDLLANLKKLAPADNDPQHFILIVPFFWIVDALSLPEWLALFFTLFLLAGFLGFAAFINANARYALLLRRGFIALIAAALVIGVFCGTRYYQTYYTRYAIVMKSNVPIYSGPSNKFPQLMVVPEGTKLRKLRFDDPNWAMVTLMDGQKGFTPADKISPI